MIKKKDGPIPREEDKLESSALPGTQSPKLSLSQEARALGWKYWTRVVIGFFVMIFLAGFVCNSYLQYKYSEVFQASPCQLCRDLNNQTATCFNYDNSSASYPDTSWLTLHPLRELGYKARWLQIPCDVCGEVQGGPLAQCLNETFAPKRTKINNGLNLSGFNLSKLSLPEEDTSS